jgi:hypothetical protein
MCKLGYDFCLHIPMHIIYWPVRSSACLQVCIQMLELLSLVVILQYCSLGDNGIPTSVQNDRWPPRLVCAETYCYLAILKLLQLCPDISGERDHLQVVLSGGQAECADVMYFSKIGGQWDEVIPLQLYSAAIYDLLSTEHRLEYTGPLDFLLCILWLFLL